MSEERAKGTRAGGNSQAGFERLDLFLSLAERKRELNAEERVTEPAPTEIHPHSEPAASPSAAAAKSAETWDATYASGER